jgi:hypothetical protein
LLVFANKQDLPNAMNAAEITDKLGLHSLRQRHWYVSALINLYFPPGSISTGPLPGFFFQGGEESFHKATWAACNGL